ncbi:hypothetical protein [Cyanobium sp. CH-040]|uniref:hypothetical protein n=1 Tax=Cyanobium sp. CH-040 TaxID=2823708 RepID=UPI0020CBD9CD|nr:hypothetical protein [Cyanobium sp. CH-040]MCP9927831.1 hypothetical protein [Cyanobium sp. CH-040]
MTAAVPVIGIDVGVYAAQLSSRERAVGYPGNVYGWMLQGGALYRELEASQPLLTGLPAIGWPAVPLAGPTARWSRG